MNISIPTLVLSVTAALFSTSLLADTNNSNAPVKPSQIVSLVSSGARCPAGGVAVDQVVDPVTLAHTAFTINPGKVFILDNVSSYGGGAITLQTAAGDWSYIGYITNGMALLNGVVVKPDITVCVSVSSNAVGYLAAHGYITKDN